MSFVFTRLFCQCDPVAYRACDFNSTENELASITLIYTTELSLKKSDLLTNQHTM